MMHGSTTEQTLPLQTQISDIAAKAGSRAIAASFYDYESETGWSFHGDRWFHAASTIKVPVLVAVMGAIEEGKFALDSRLHVRNRFLSIVDQSLFTISAGRDANAAVHRAIGKTMSIESLCKHMIVTSSNLATNLLLELVGIEAAQAYLNGLGIGGIKLQRIIEDEKAYEAGINNEVSANGLLKLFRLLEERKMFSDAACEKMLEILHQQEFKRGIPAGLPDTAKVAHKTGGISTVQHDAGLVFLPARKPYVIVILSEWYTSDHDRQGTVSEVSQRIYEYLIGGEEAQ